MFLLIDKPKGITSHDVVDRVRKVTGERRVGHGGTLDPNATGLLIVGVGRESTKHLGDISSNTTKTYVAEVELGEERDTDDSEGNKRILPQKVRDSHIAKSLRDDKAVIKSLTTLSKDDIKKLLSFFIGEQEQIPPIYSAIKSGGKKAYEMARKGKDIEMKPRIVVIHSINLIQFEYPIVEIECEVSSGTYIRSLARDIGRKLEVGGFLKNLRRTRIGKFDIKDAVKLDDLNSSNWEKFSVSLTK